MSGTLANISAMSVTGTPGTGTITLNAALSSYITFADAGVVDGDIVTYMAKDGTAREIGTATYTASGTTLSSRSVLNSTNSNAAVSLTSAAEIYLTAAAQDLYTGALYPKLTRPRNGDFSDINTPTVAVNANGGVSIISGSSGGVRARVKTLPTPPFTITAAFLMHFYKATDQEAGILLRQTSDGKLFSHGFYSNNTAVGVASRDYTNVTTVSGTNANFDQPSTFGLVWLQLTDNNTNNILKWGYDGYTWQTLLTESRTMFITADQVGFYARTTNSNSCTATMVSWAQT